MLLVLSSAGAWGAKDTNELLQNVSHEALRPGFDISKEHDIYSYFQFLYFLFVVDFVCDQLIHLRF